MTSQNIDIYQIRYERYQERKRKLLDGEIDYIDHKEELDSYAFTEIVKNRVSQRKFNNKPIDENELFYIKQVIINTPSSCNRQAVQIKIVAGEDKKELEELLVGGKEWMGAADKIILLLADMEAYKSPTEVDFMPYLDAGFIGMSVYYATTAIGIGCCFVNPNIREKNKDRFKKYSGDYRFCGAIAIGNYDKKGFLSTKDDNIFTGICT